MTTSDDLADYAVPETDAATLSLTKKEGWQHWVDTGPAPIMAADEMPTRRTYDKWDNDNQFDFDERRGSHHMNPPFVATPTVKKFMSVARQRIKGNQQRGATDFVVAVSAPGTMGKSWMLKNLGRDFHLRERKRTGRTGDPNFWPVIYIASPPSGSPLMIAQQMASFLGTSIGNGNLAAAEEALFTVLPKVGLGMVIVDEAHNMNRADSQGRFAGDHMKYMLNRLPRGVTIVYGGIGLDTDGPLVDVRSSQTEGRSVRIDIPPFSMDTADDRKVWLGVLKTFEGHLRLFDHKPGTLTGLAGYLLERTQGSIGSLTELLGFGAMEAVDSGTEALTQDLLDNVIINVGAESKADREYADQQAAETTERKKRASQKSTKSGGSKKTA